MKVWWKANRGFWRPRNCKLRSGPGCCGGRIKVGTIWTWTWGRLEHIKTCLGGWLLVVPFIQIACSFHNLLWDSFVVVRSRLDCINRLSSPPFLDLCSDVNMNSMVSPFAPLLFLINLCWEWDVVFCFFFFFFAGPVEKSCLKIPYLNLWFKYFIPIHTLNWAN